MAKKLGKLSIRGRR